MKISTTLIVSVILAAHLHNTWACENEIEEIKPAFSTQRQETIDKPFEKHFHNSKGDNYFLNAKTLTLNNKDYPWYIQEDHRKTLSDRKNLHNRVLDELNKVEKKSFQDLDKVIGFSLDICGDEVSVNPYPSRMDKIMTSSIDNVHFLSLTISFPCFLGSLSSRVASNWPAALSKISKEVSALHYEEYIDNLSYAHTSIRHLSLHYFNKLVFFCKSDSCDLRSRTILFSLFSLVPPIINSYPIPSEEDCVIYGLQDSSGRNKLALDFGIFLKNSYTTALSLVESNAMLFNRVGELISNFDDWMGNK